ncbi:hypothetical protein K2X30_04835 [bacterium]|nr:hypothetical protein [bacterium]
MKKTLLAFTGFAVVAALPMFIDIPSAHSCFPAYSGKTVWKVYQRYTARDSYQKEEVYSVNPARFGSSVVQIDEAAVGGNEKTLVKVAVTDKEGLMIATSDASVLKFIGKEGTSNGLSTFAFEVVDSGEAEIFTNQSQDVQVVKINKVVSGQKISDLDIPSASTGGHSSTEVHIYVEAGLKARIKKGSVNNQVLKGQRKFQVTDAKDTWDVFPFEVIGQGTSNVQLEMVGTSYSPKEVISVKKFIVYPTPRSLAGGTC